MLYLYAICNTPVSGPWPDSVNLNRPADSVAVEPWCAVVSEVDEDFVADCGTDSKQRDLNWIGPRALRHEAVVECAQGQAAVIPARFGTLFSSPNALKHWVGQNSAALAEVFRKVSGAEEWGVSAEMQPVTSREAESKDGGATPGRGYLLAALNRKRAEAKRVALLDAAISDLSRCLGAISREVAERRPGNWAYLVPRENRQIFALAAEEFSRPELGLRFKLSGPWPPYSFVREFPQGHRAGSFEAASTQGGVGVRGQTASAVQA